MATPTERDSFEISGPLHLLKPDWFNPSHRRSIAASLVQAVYVLQRDRQENRHSPSHALAPSWWKFFNFHPTQFLVETKDGSIFAAVFENRHAPETGAPAAVIAFRGSIFKPDTLRTDLKLDLVLIANGLHKTARFEQGLQAVRSSIARNGGHRNVWLAGHSLGAALALAAGRKICEEEGFRLECHLFNPPFASAPVERIKNEKLKVGVHIAHNFVIAGLAVTVKGRRSDAHDAFDVIQEWIPNLYVNSCDYICSGYVGYFENRERMQNLGVGKIGKIAARHSINDCIVSAFGKESKASHLIPSGRLTVNLNPSSEFKKAHGIRQWWSPELQFRCTLFTLGTPKK